ncbi:MAG: PaaI family thioesterase [Mycobacteriales bacterium]
MTDGPTSVFDGDLGLATEQERAAHRLFTKTPLHRLLGLRFEEIGADAVVATMPVREEAFNSSGNLHGGALATLIDVAAGTAAAVSSQLRLDEATIVTADVHVRYLSRPRGDLVRARATVLRAGRSLVIVECRVTDAEGHLIAVADFSSMIVPLREPLREPLQGPSRPRDQDLRARRPPPGNG